MQYNILYKDVLGVHIMSLTLREDKLGYAGLMDFEVKISLQKTFDQSS